MLPAGKSLDSTLTALPSVAELPFHIMGRFAKPIAIGQCRDTTIEGFSSKEAFERVRDLSLGLGALGMAAGDRVAILAESRPEWICSDLAILAAGAVTVPIYPTLCGVAGALHPPGLRRPPRRRLDKRAARQAAGGAAPAAGARSGGRHGRAAAGAKRLLS